MAQTPGKVGLTTATDFFPVTPDDNNDLSVNVRALLIVTAGTLRVNTTDGAPRTINLNVPAGRIDISVSRVHATGTTAAGITGLV